MSRKILQGQLVPDGLWVEIRSSDTPFIGVRDDDLRIYHELRVLTTSTPVILTKIDPEPQ